MLWVTPPAWGEGVPAVLRQRLDWIASGKCLDLFFLYRGFICCFGPVGSTSCNEKYVIYLNNGHDHPFPHMFIK